MNKLWFPRYHLYHIWKRRVMCKVTSVHSNYDYVIQQSHNSAHNQENVHVTRLSSLVSSSDSTLCKEGGVWGQDYIVSRPSSWVRVWVKRQDYLLSQLHMCEGCIWEWDCTLPCQGTRLHGLCMPKITCKTFQWLCVSICFIPQKLNNQGLSSSQTDASSVNEIERRREKERTLWIRIEVTKKKSKRQC